MAEAAKRGKGEEIVEVSDPVCLRQIKEYIAAMDDWDPLYFDEETASKGPHGKIAAPMLFTSAPLRKIVPESDLWEDGQHKTMAISGIEGRSLHGGEELEFYKALHVGDIVTSRARTVDAYAKEGRSGAMVFQITEKTYSNQHDEVLAIERTTHIFR